MVFSPDLGGKIGGVLSMRMQFILDSSFARPGSAPIWDGKKEEFRDWTTSTPRTIPIVRAPKTMKKIRYPKTAKNVNLLRWRAIEPQNRKRDVRHMKALTLK